MSAYNLETIIKKWGQGTLTTEQTIGQILLLVKDLSSRVGELEKRHVLQSNRQRPENKSSSGK